MLCSVEGGSGCVVCSAVVLSCVGSCAVESVVASVVGASVVLSDTVLSAGFPEAPQEVSADRHSAAQSNFLKNGRK